MDELDLLWEDIITNDPSYVESYEKHVWKKDILQDDQFFRNIFDFSKSKGFQSLKDFNKVEDYWNRVHGHEPKESKALSKVSPLVSDTEDKFNYNPNAVFTGKTFDLPNVVGILTWKNNKNIIDMINGDMAWSNTGIPGNWQRGYSEIMKKKLMTGKYGLDTRTGSLFILPESEQLRASEEEWDLSLSRDEYHAKVKKIQEEEKAAQEAEEAQTKELAINDWVKTQTSNWVVQAPKTKEDIYETKYVRSYDQEKINILNPNNKSFANVMSTHHASGNSRYYPLLTVDGSVWDENNIHSWWNDNTMSPYMQLTPKFFPTKPGTRHAIPNNAYVQGDPNDLGDAYSELLEDWQEARWEFNDIRAGKDIRTDLEYGGEIYNTALHDYTIASQKLMEFYFTHHIDGVSASKSFQTIQDGQTHAIAAQTLEANVTASNPNKSAEEVYEIMVTKKEESTFYSAANQLGTSDREWTVKDAEDMAQVNVQSKELLTDYYAQRNDIAQEIYDANGKKGKEAEKLALAQAEKRMENSEVASKLKDLNTQWYNIIGRELENPDRAVMIIDVSTGQLVRKDEVTSNEGQQSAKDYDQIINDFSSGIFTNDTVKNLLFKLQRDILNDMTSFNAKNYTEKEIGIHLGGSGWGYEGGFLDKTQDVLGITTQGNLKTTQEDLDDMNNIIENFKKTGLIDFNHLTPVNCTTPLCKSYNSKLNTLRALSEVYLMNFDPVKSLENKAAETTHSFWTPQGKAEAGEKMLEGMKRGLPEAFGVDMAGVYDDELQQEFVTSMINDFGVDKQITIKDKETGEDIQVNALQNELDKKLDNVSTWYTVGRQVPTFAVMIAETAAIEFLTAGMGSGVALANIGRRATQLYRTAGLGRKTSVVAGGWTKMMLHEAMILEGSNQIGSHAWGRERMPVWSFALGSSLARLGVTGLGRRYNQFKTNMLSASAQRSSPAAVKWGTVNSIVNNNPLLLGTPLRLAGYAPKKMLQAGIGTATIKSGELVGSIADVFSGEMNWTQFWDHALDADSFVETFGTMLVMGMRSGGREGKIGFKTLMSDLKNFGTTAATRKYNAAADMYGGHLRKIKNYSAKNHEGRKSSWTAEEIDLALSKRIKEINSNKELTPSEQQKEINNLQEVSKFLKLKSEIDQTRYDQPSMWDAAYGEKSMSGEFENLLGRLAKGVETNYMDQLKLGQISSWSEGANRNALIKELMGATGMSELKAKEYVDWCENLAKVNDAYGFRKGSKNQREFFKLQSQGFKLEVELEQLKKSHKKGEINKATLDLQSEIIKEKQKSLLEREKGLIELEAKETNAEIEKLKKSITEAEVIETKEGQTVNQAIIDLYGKEAAEALENRAKTKFEKDNRKELKELEKLKQREEIDEMLLEEMGIDVRRSDYGAHIDIKTKGGVKTYTIVDKAKAAKAQVKFNENFERSKPLLAEGKDFSIMSKAKRNTLFHEIIHPLVEKSVATNPEFVGDFINTLKKTGEYNAVLEQLKTHPDYKPGYKGSEWLTIYGEMVKDGKLDPFAQKGDVRTWKNLASKLKEVVNKETAFKDANFETGEGARNFLARFAKAKGKDFTKLSKVANEGIKEYKKWLEGENPELSQTLNKSAVKDVEPEMIKLYKENARDWSEGGWKKALETMEKEGLLDRLIGANLPVPRPKGWTQRMDANFVRSVYSEISQLVKGFSEVKQTTSGAKGFFAYINSYLSRKAIDVKRDMGVYDQGKKSLDQMKEQTGYDVVDQSSRPEEVYVKATSEQTAKKLGLNESSIEQLNKDMKELDFPKLIEAYEKPAGRNQTISPFVREFKKQFGAKGTAAVEKSMGKTKAEYTDYVSKNFESIVRGLPIGYVSRNFPFLVTKGGKEVTGTTGRDKRWTSGPKSMKVKENLTEADKMKFIEAAVPSRWGAKKKGLAYQIADSWGSKKFLETIEMKNEIEYKLDQAEKDFNTSRLELDNKEITQAEFNKRRDTYMSTVKELLAQGEVTSQFGEAFKVKQLEAGDFTQKINQQIEISNFRRSSTLAEAIRVEVGTDASLGLEITDRISSILKEKLPSKLIKAGWPDVTETELKNLIKEVTEVEGKAIDLGNGFTIDNKIARGMAKDLLNVGKKVIQGYKYSKGNIENRIEREAKDLQGDIEKIKAEEIADFEVQKMLDRGLEVSESAKLQKQLDINISAKEKAIERANEGVEHTMKYLNKKLKDSTDPVKTVINYLKYNTNHLVSAGGARGKRGQFFGGKPDLFETMKPILKEYGIDLEYQVYKKGHPKEGSLKPGSLKINGKEVKADLQTKGQNPKSLKWLMEYATEMEADPNWAKNNPEKFKRLEKEIKEREIEANEFQKNVLDEMIEDFKDFKKGEIDKELLFLKLNSYNTNMTTHLRSSANLTDVMIPLKGDRLKNLTVEHKRAADPLLRELTAILNNKGSWIGSGKTLRLKKSAKDMLNKAFDNYETALIETYEKGETKTLDKLLEDQYKTDKAFQVIKGGERYGRAFNLATYGDPRARAMLNLKDYIKTKDYEASKYGKEHEIAAKIARNEKVTAADRKVVENIGLWNRSSTKGKTKQELIDITKTADKALEKGREINSKKKKARIFDFDDTVARTNSKVFATKGGEKKILTAEEFAKEGERLVEEGWKMDFSDFNKVVEGKKGPLFDLMKKMKESPGDRDMFILTARAPESATAIHEFLKAMGIDIPLENIKGLGNSTGEAKAEWIVDKAAEGYNDFYFADDAIQNVEAVKKALEPIDVKSKVQQARFNRSSENLDMMFNKIIENKTGIEWQKEFSSAKAKVRGKENQKRKFWIPPSAEDFTGLMDFTLGKGKVGEQQREFYNETLYKPYSRGINSLATERVNMMGDFKAIKNQLKVPKDLRKKTKSGFTKEQAVRVYLWNKTGQKIPGLSKTDLAELNTIIESDGKLHAFAESILQLTKGDGYNKPGQHWLSGTITTDLIDVLSTTKRSKYLQEWRDNVDVIFSEKNMNKLEAAYGPKYREALENMLTRMKSGKNRTETGNRLGNQVLDYINNAQGTIMFLNMRSAILQTISSANFINIGFNNPLKAGKAFANQPQYWKDFMELMNSDYLVDRRNGLKMNISESEIADAAATSSNKAKAAVNYILEKGYAPTRFADSFAIASGGATWYRNRINDLMKKEGLSEEAAKAKAYEEFMEISEKSQQSSDPSKISMQQASDVGRIFLQFVNTPMQYARLQKAAFKDIVNKRGDWKSNVSKIVYYGIVQNLWFNMMQQGAFALGFGDEATEEDVEEKGWDTANGAVDSILRGLGLGGMTVSVLKNFVMDIAERSQRERPEYSDAWETLLEFSPALKSKLKKIKSAGRPFDSKKGRQAIMDKGFSLDNPAFESFAKVFSATTNVPLDRVLQKIENLQGAANSENETWMRVAMFLGWPEWQLQTKDQKDKSRKGEDPSLYNKAQQVDILKQHGYSDEEIKAMEDKETRTNAILDKQEESGKVYTTKIGTGPLKASPMRYSQYQLDSLEYTKLNKPKQVEMLDSLGLSKKEIRALKYEADRVEKLLELMKDD